MQTTFLSHLISLFLLVLKKNELMLTTMFFLDTRPPRLMYTSTKRLLHQSLPPTRMSPGGTRTLPPTTRNSTHYPAAALRANHSLRLALQRALHLLPPPKMMKTSTSLAKTRKWMRKLKKSRPSALLRTMPKKLPSRRRLPRFLPP